MEGSLYIFPGSKHDKIILNHLNLRMDPGGAGGGNKKPKRWFWVAAPYVRIQLGQKDLRIKLRLIFRNEILPESSDFQVLKIIVGSIAVIPFSM